MKILYQTSLEPGVNIAWDGRQQENDARNSVLILEEPYGQTLTNLVPLRLGDLEIFQINPEETYDLFSEIFGEKQYWDPWLELNPGAVVLDVGAHIGLFSIFVTLQCPDINIYAFEPSLPVFEVLQTNGKLWNLPIEVFPVGLSSSAGKATFTYYPHYPALSGLHADPNRELQLIETHITNKGFQLHPDQKELLKSHLKTKKFSCQLKTLAQVIDEQDLNQIDLLKIDVEHNEWEVLCGMDQSRWHLVKQVIVEVHDEHGRVDKVHQLLRDQGFETKTNQRGEFKNTAIQMIYAVRPKGRSMLAGTPIPSPAKWSWEAPCLTTQAIRTMLYSRSPEGGIEANFWPSPYDYDLDQSSWPETKPFPQLWALAACQLPQNIYANPGFTLAGRRLIQALYQNEGRPFDFRAIIHPFNPSFILSQKWVPATCLKDSTTQSEGELILRWGRLDGFAWFPLDSKGQPNFKDWLNSPVFLPLNFPGIGIDPGTEVKYELKVHTDQDARHSQIDLEIEIGSKNPPMRFHINEGPGRKPFQHSAFSKHFYTPTPQTVVDPPANLSSQVEQYLARSPD